MHLVRDILDNQMHDMQGNAIGRVDGIVIEWRDDKPPRVIAIESGAGVLGRRLGPRIERFVLWIIRVLHLPVAPRTRIAWERLQYVGVDLQIQADSELVDTQKFERALRDHVVCHIPGSR